MPTPLAQHLQTRIRTGGPLSVAEYMQECLYHPDHGYYTRGLNFLPQPPTEPPTPRDYLTAPEHTPLFAYTLANWTAKTWRKLGCPTPFALVEGGPGRGTLMRDLLGHLQQAHPACYAAAQPTLVETSPALTGLQRQTLENFSQCGWQTELPSPAIPMIFIANELLDAFPIHQFCRKEDQWHEVTVTLSGNDNLIFSHRPTTEAAGCHPGTWMGRNGVSPLRGTHHVSGTRIPPPPLPFQAPETSSPASSPPQDIQASTLPWLETSPTQREFLQTLKTRATAALLIDYGYREENIAPLAPNQPPETLSTLQAMHLHRPVHPLELPGEADLTAHVNFSAVAATLGQDHTRVTDLAPFLLSHGLPELGLQHPQEQSALQRLLHPSMMGRLFKVACYTPNTR